jgi:hypothetical protein
VKRFTFQRLRVGSVNAAGRLYAAALLIYINALTGLSDPLAMQDFAARAVSER